MASFSLQPTSTVLNSGALTGGASADAILSDGSDASYITYDPGEASWVGYEDITLPAGAVLKNIVSILRSLQVGGGLAILHEQLNVAGHTIPETTINVYWAAHSTHYGSVYASDALTEAQIDGMSVTYGMSGTAGTTIHLYSADVLVFYVTQPTVNITAPTGTLTVDSSPTVTWTPTLDSEGGGQTHYEVTIRDSTSAVVVESGLIGAASTSWDFPGALNDGNYTAQVRIAQTVNGDLLWSALDSQAFTINTPDPATPTMTLIPDSGNGRIQIDLADPGGGAVTTTFWHVESSTDNIFWDEVRSDAFGGFITPVAGAATVYDYDAPNGQVTYYRAHASHWFVTGGTVTTSNSAYAKDSDMWESTEWWLKHPTRPSLNYHPRLRSAPSRTEAGRQGVFNPLGRRNPIVVSDVRTGWTGDVVFICSNDQDRENLDAILADGLPVLLQAPPDVYWDDRYMSIGDHTRERMVDAGWNPVSFDSVSWIEVDRPIDQIEE